MRLRSIYIKEYHALKDFFIDFTANDTLPGKMRSYTLHLIVGVNGTGKSTLLRLLVKLFRRLQNRNNRIPDFGFRVSYQLRAGSDIIWLTNLDDDNELLTGDTRLYIRQTPEGQSEEDVAYRQFRSGDSENLPERIIAFTTGNEQEWLNDLSADEQLDASNDKSVLLLPDPQSSNFQEQLREWYLHELPGAPIDDAEENTRGQERGKITERDFYFITAAQIPLITLCGMLVDMNDATQSAKQTEKTEESKFWQHLDNVMADSGIKALRGFSLRFRMNQDNLDTNVRTFIDSLRRLAHHTVQTGSDYLLVFDLQQQQDVPAQLLAEGSFYLFTRLVRLTESQTGEEVILQEVNLFLERHYALKKRDEPSATDTTSQSEGASSITLPLHMFRWLSDGEQSFLGRLCLMPLLRDTDALILLDEPEVHFNDYWKRQLVLTLDEALRPEQPPSNGTDNPPLQSCHVLMTTHSSITLTDVPRTNIILLKRYNGYTGETLNPDLTTLGADPSDIITSIFEAESATGAKGSNYILHEIDEIQKKLSSPREQIEQLKNLRDNVGPGYWRYRIRREIHWLEGQTTQSTYNGQKGTSS